jgi:Pyridoxamine 5'-phosphate oxidase
VATWEAFVLDEPELAAFGWARLDDGISYLATVRPDGGPRVHPVAPWIAAGHLWVRMFPGSAKVTDLEHDPRYALHTAVADASGGEGEFALRGTAELVVDTALLRAANEGKPEPDRYCVFDLGIDYVMATTYDGETLTRRRWRPPPVPLQA